MKKINKILTVLIGISIFMFYSCETTEMNIIDNPNNLTPSQANADLTLISIQGHLANFVEEIGDRAQQASRIRTMRGRNYESAFSPTSFNTAWNRAYIGILNNGKLIKEFSEQIPNLEKHAAIVNVIEAYTLITLVDVFGDIPLSEALNTANLNPRLDNAEDVYAEALLRLNDAIAVLESGAGQNVANDFFYNNDSSKWIKLANTLKLKTYLQTRRVDANAITKFNTLINQNNFINSNEDSFVFNWGSNLLNPNSRHPKYNDSYGPGGVPDIGLYMSNWLMDLMKNSKSNPDPRMRYYFYRQVDDVIANINPETAGELPCAVEEAPAHYQNIGAVFCFIDNDEGYWGRDHGDQSGIPNDGARRTIFGVYPVGGKFDNDSFEHIDGQNYGAEGYGITPILLASTVDFWRAEAALFGGNGNAEQHLESAVTKSMNYVISFGLRDTQTEDIQDFAPSQDDINDYISEVSAALNNAGSDQAKLNVIGNEFFVSLIGNGIDAYNFYRRTGSPTTIQPNLEPNPGRFFRSFWYPATSVSANSSINQKENLSVRVFWDDNPVENFPINN